MAIWYRSYVAKCLYISKRTRPEILFAVNQLCRKARAPTKSDGEALTKLLRYLKGSDFATDLEAIKV